MFWSLVRFILSSPSRIKQQQSVRSEGSQIDQIIHSQHLAYQETFQPTRHTLLLKADKMLCAAIYNPFLNADCNVGSCKMELYTTLSLTLKRMLLVCRMRRVITVITDIVPFKIVYIHNAVFQDVIQRLDFDICQIVKKGRGKKSRK